MNTSQVKITREFVIAEIQRIARGGGHDMLTLPAFRAATGIGQHYVYQLFDGWREACEAAGLKAHTEFVRIEDDALFEEMRRVFLECGGICTRRMFARRAQHSVTTYKSRWGQWQRVLLSFLEWLDHSGREFAFKDRLAQEVASVKRAALPADSQEKTRRHWPAAAITTYGPFLNFRGLQHAPINEQGVVFLFGMVCAELGFVVEAVRTGYPDCEAKRRVHRSRDEWQRVKIEFEFRSSEFKAHGHDPQACDLIVCWEHDWSDCPLEVVELKTEIGKLDSHAAQRNHTRGPMGR